MFFKKQRKSTLGNCGNRNFEFTDEQWKKLYSAFAKMSLWDGVDKSKVKEARKESYSVINSKKTKAEEFVDTLAEYYKRTIKDTPIHNVLNVANEGSYASNLLKNDKGLNDFVKSKIEEYAKKYKSPHLLIKDESYEIPLGNGDLGASLHYIDIDIDARRGRDGKWNAVVKVSDDFDFTELKNPFKQDSFKEGSLWFANDMATISSKMGLLDEVGVEITYSKKY